MIPRKILIVAVWALSLVGVAVWTARAQGPQAPGFEVRFMAGTGKPGAPHGTLLANINGQWLPVTLNMTPLPDGNVR